MKVYESLHKGVTCEVVSQYIQHERVSREFAEYYELYQKYQQDYQIAEILKGQNSEAMVKKVAHASFDEKVSVVNLLFSGVRQAIRQVILREEVLDQVFAVLKELKTGFAGGKAAQRLGDYVDNLQGELLHKKKAGLLEHRKEYSLRKALDILNQYTKILKENSEAQGEEAFNLLRTAFGSHRQQWEDAWDQAGDMLEYAFDFMEAAFYNSQEMVMFVSGMNTDFYCVRFLETYECERYIRYNRDLLFEDVSGEIRRRIMEL